VSSDGTLAPELIAVDLETIESREDLVRNTYTLSARHHPRQTLEA